MTDFTEKEDNVTTEDDFEYFRQKCLEVAEYLGLKRYQLYFDYLEIDKEILADCHINISSSLATIRLNKKWGPKKVTDYALYRTAFHEVCHILTARFIINAKSRFVAEDEIDEAEHELVRTLENTLFEDYLFNVE